MYSQYQYKRDLHLHTRVEMYNRESGVLWQVGVQCQCGGMVNYGEER